MRISKRAWWTCAAMLIGGTFGAAAQAQDDQEARIRQALNSPERSAENKAEDPIRKPIQVIDFLGIETGMTVLDVIAAGGWYTEVLSAAVGPSGTVLSHNPPFFVNREGFAESEQALVDRLGNVEPVHGSIAEAGIEGRADAAITAKNLHDLFNRGGAEAALPLLRGIYDALKPGGVFGVIDHRGLPGEDNAEMHRMTVEDARELLVEAGFTVEAESNLLAVPEDDHTTSVHELGGKTDRFLLRARKPE